MLFQSGYGSSSAGHRFFCQKVAAEGFIVIAPDRTDDHKCGCCGIIGFLNLVSCSALSVDGSHLAMAADYAKNKSNRFMDRADATKMAISGFSMGAQEAVHAAARLPGETKAVVILSGSIMLPLATAIGWNCCCAPCNPGSTCCSDSPLGMCGMAAAIRSWTFPSLVVTSDLDMTKSGNYRLHEIAGGHSTLVTFKDSALDLDIPTTKATSAWGGFACAACYTSPLYGMRQHFALGNEENDVAHEPVRRHHACTTSPEWACIYLVLNFATLGWPG